MPRSQSRASLESVAFGLASEGLNDVLALSGDYPKEGFGGLSAPVFDIDSVALARAARAPRARTGAAFHAGCAVNPFKSVERDLVPQLLKLRIKVRAGARFAIAQVGWDARAWDELVRWTRRDGLAVPLIAAVYILGRGVGRVFHSDGVPGIRLTAPLWELGRAGGGQPGQGPLPLPRAGRQAGRGRARARLRRHLPRGAAQRGEVDCGPRDGRPLRTR